MEVTPKLVFRGPDLGFDVHFAKPQLRLLNVSTNILDNFMEAMAPFGATLPSLKVDVPSQELWRSHIAVSILGGLGIAGFGPSSLGIQLKSFPVAPQPDLLSAIVAPLLEAAEGAIGKIELAGHSLTIRLHGQLQGATPTDFIAQFLSHPPECLGPATASGLTYTLGSLGYRRSLVLRVEPSESLRPGLFIGATLELYASEIGASEAPRFALEHVREIMAHGTFPLEVEWAQTQPG